MKHILIIKDVKQLERLKNKTIVVETDSVDAIESIAKTVKTNNFLFCIKIRVKQEITTIPFKKEWRKIPLAIYPDGLGAVRDLMGLLTLLKTLNIRFFLDGAMKQNYEAVQILSSLGIFSGIIINESADWKKLTNLMYYALYSKVPHAPIEPFQYLYSIYTENSFANYDTVFFNDPSVFRYLDDEDQVAKSWRKSFREVTSCSACAGWQICMGKYAGLEDKTGCREFTIEWLNHINKIKFKR
jgi:hypothetical protein